MKLKLSFVVCTVVALTSWAQASEERAGSETADQASADKATQVLRSIDWKKGPVKVDIGAQAEMEIPEGYLFTAGPGTRKMLELMQNPTGGRELGLLMPLDSAWFVIFEFSDIGYVKDADKEKLDKDEILASIKKGVAASNARRKKRGWPEITVTGWQTAPFYDVEARNLKWCIEGQSRGQRIVNYNTRILGRHGVMSANLLVRPDRLEMTTPIIKDLLEKFSFKEGQGYAEFKEGDKIAEYGLAALVVGGAVGIAAKVGLLGKLVGCLGKAWKLVVVAVLGLIAGLRKLFGLRPKAPEADYQPYSGGDEIDPDSELSAKIEAKANPPLDDKQQPK
ncbi:MAG: DUF2167 domain-containing protein [Deltaproteobacteria bacterium]|nr:DUF2167 domain-containing protein [Deltaproteobacteria bacterium]